MAFQQRLGIRLLNRCGQALTRAGWRKNAFDPNALEALARENVGASDFGSDRYRVPFMKLCESYAADPDLTFLGRQVCQGALLHLLENRLKIQRDLKANPAILEKTVVRPVFILGLPRTGTTMLYNLLACDPAARPLMFWESMCPSPPPLPNERTTDARIAKAQSTVARLNRVLPELQGIHKFVADGPEECLGLLMNVFLTPFFRGRIKPYRAWLDTVTDAEIDAAYEEYRAQLQLLQWHVTGSHWLLKCPSHLFGLGGLLHAFPDACVIQCHRNLENSVPSLCSLTATIDQLCYAEIDPHQVGQRVLHYTEQLIDRGMKARDQNPHANIWDVQYEQLIAAPIDEVRRIYAHLGTAVSPAFEQAMQQHLAQGRPEKLHKYTLEQFGLSSADLQERFRTYRERFHLS
ncbi:hypothetical protein GC163_15165 [bacterium]|nr:hypothetical protein [bacterium]